MSKQGYLVSEKSKIAIIALHGWTGDALSMKPISKNFNYPNIKWVFPQGPYNANKANQSLKKNDEFSGYSWSQNSMRDHHSLINNYVFCITTFVNILFCMTTYMRTYTYIRYLHLYVYVYLLYRSH